MTRNEIPSLDNDGLFHLPVGSWAEEKYRLVGLYASLFAASMKAKWDHRVYIDLFAGPGRSKLEDSGRVLPGTPTLALLASPPFTRYVFCEANENSIGALQTRCARDFPTRDVRFVAGDCNDQISAVIGNIPEPSRDSTVLSFCFADPFRVSQLKFKTLERLAGRYVDFLILIPTGMDASRNWLQQFQDDKPTAIDDFVGTREWREAWATLERQGMSFDAFFTQFFYDRMKTLGYCHGGVNTSIPIRNPDRNQLLYRLGFFSKHSRGENFWKEALRYSSRQLGLNFPT